jgi:hypothetical protein
VFGFIPSPSGGGLGWGHTRGWSAPIPTFPQRGKEQDSSYFSTTNLPSLTFSMTPVSLV